MSSAKRPVEHLLWDRFLASEHVEELEPALEDRGTYLMATFPLPPWAAKRDIDVTVHDGVLAVTVDARRSTRGKLKDLRARGALHIGPIPPEDILVEFAIGQLRILIPSLGPDPMHVPIVDRSAQTVLA